MKAPQAPRSRRGFTLVEVLVALLIMAIMAAMAWQGVDGISRARAASEGQVNRILRLDAVLAQWEQDLAAVETTGVVTQALACDGASLRMTRRADEGIQLVVWALRNGTLSRWASPPVTTRRALQEHWLRSQQLVGSEPGHLALLAGVSDWQIYFYQRNAWANCQSSGDVAQAPSPAGSAVAPELLLPNGVRLMLGFGEGSGFVGNLTRDTRLSPTAP